MLDSLNEKMNRGQEVDEEHPDGRYDQDPDGGPRLPFAAEPPPIGELHTGKFVPFGAT